MHSRGSGNRDTVSRACYWQERERGDCRKVADHCGTSVSPANDPFFPVASSLRGDYCVAAIGRIKAAS